MHEAAEGAEGEQSLRVGARLRTLVKAFFLPRDVQAVSAAGLLPTQRKFPGKFPAGRT